jgi:poly-gamma-glutamate capsule biosynthesis protein CapA/YwtB (metallophosphatase superfamily)
MVTAGTGTDISEAARPGILRTRHGTIAMVGFASGGLVDDSGIAGPNRPGVFQLKARSDRTWEPSDRERVLAAVRSATGQADWVLAYHHNHEYDQKIGQQVPDSQKQIARLCVDAGATFYVAHGFPGIRAVEFYKGHPLFHGLGNFIFQTRRVVYYATDKAAWQSVVVKFQLGKSVPAEIRVYPVSLSENQRREEGQGVLFPAGAPRPAIGEEAQMILGTFGHLCEELGTHVTTRDTYAVVTA